MQYAGLAGLVGCLALLLLYLTLRCGWRLDWLYGWLKGSLLLLLLLCCAIVAVAAWELYQFRPIADGARIATLELHETAPQRYEATLSSAAGSQHLQLEGDLWELEVQVLRWQGFPHVLGLQDGYRLDTLNGRYLALEQQRETGLLLDRSLHATPRWRDAWRWLDRLDFGWLYADAFAIRFMPAAEGAEFAIEIGATGLSPVATNLQALEVLKGFE
ncbi:hypothetical protein SAMN05216198_1222 [Halopseudomonas litoralis]|uniref:Cation/multidrug efflux pump n=1 Tax=Halopseudomonas litoralis TaxID=797277 RepID=A0A1H1PLW4_9GAMM|nr:hypothetical protein [Halopseudomonas litoralis]SDS12055.1 hypothetical protein SAMN05216198_1222 [Halopseudomonas litoralis]